MPEPEQPVEALKHKHFEAYAGRKIDAKLVIVYVGRECWSRLQSPGWWVRLDP